MILDTKIPTILIHVTPDCPKNISQEIMWGIEEEGIPCELEELRFEDITKEGHSSASLSLLDVGVASDGQHIVAHYSKLPIDNPMFSQKIINQEQVRTIGKNIARFVKGIPFILGEVEND